MAKEILCTKCNFFDGENCLHVDNIKIEVMRRTEKLIYKEKADKVKCKNVQPSV